MKSRFTSPTRVFLILVFVCVVSIGTAALSRAGVWLFWGFRTLDGICLSIFRSMEEPSRTWYKAAAMIILSQRGVVCWPSRPFRTTTSTSRHRPCWTSGRGKHTCSRHYGRTRIASFSFHQLCLQGSRTSSNPRIFKAKAGGKQRKLPSQRCLRRNWCAGGP